jgi:transcriptional regulator with XRE-family HTH domain
MRTKALAPPIPVARAAREFSTHVQAWRKLRGLTQAQLSDRAGVDRKTVQRIEAGDIKVSFENVLRVLNGLGVVDPIVHASDPYETDLGRLRADDQLPQRVRPRELI